MQAHPSKRAVLPIGAYRSCAHRLLSCNVPVKSLIALNAVLQVTGLMVSLLTFYFHEDVRDAAVQALPELLTCAKAAADKGMANASPQYVKQMLDYIWDKLMEAMQRVSAGLLMLNVGYGAPVRGSCRAGLSCI